MLCVSSMASHFKNKTAQPTFLKMWLVDQNSPFLFSSGTSCPFLYFVLFYSAFGNIPLDFCPFFFLIGNLPRLSETRKNHWSFFKQVITRSVWGFICQGGWNFWRGQAHVSNPGLRASDQPCGILVSAWRQPQSRRIFRASLRRLTPAGWVVPTENSSLGICLWSYNLALVSGPFF